MFDLLAFINIIKKKITFRLFYILAVGAVVLYNLIYYIVMGQPIILFFLELAIAAIWITYLFRSKRVKAVFMKPEEAAAIIEGTPISQ